MADKRADQLKEITERLEQGVKDIFTSEMYTKYLLTMSKFHNYSFNNTLLIAMQRPDATLVAGYNAWKNKFNRYVKKGEKGIQIIAPAPVKEREEREKIDKDTGLTVLNESGEPEIEVVERVIPRFRVTTVFDYAQTDGEPLPTLEVNELTARVKDYTLLKEAIEQVSPVPIRFGEIEGNAKGYYSHMDKEICVRADMGESQTIKTMIHEVAHAMSCKPFATLVYQKMGWDSECRYKMLGYRITFEGETLYVFDLLVPEIFHEGQRKKNAVDSQDNAASTKPVNSRKGFYLDDIVGTFGVPVEEHRKESEVKQMDGYVSMGILTGKIAPEAGKD